MRSIAKKRNLLNVFYWFCLGFSHAKKLPKNTFLCIIILKQLFFFFFYSNWPLRFLYASWCTNTTALHSALSIEGLAFFLSLSLLIFFLMYLFFKSRSHTSLHPARTVWVVKHYYKNIYCLLQDSQRFFFLFFSVFKLFTSLLPIIPRACVAIFSIYLIEQRNQEKRVDAWHLKTA